MGRNVDKRGWSKMALEMDRAEYLDRERAKRKEREKQEEERKRKLEEDFKKKQIQDQNNFKLECMSRQENFERKQLDKKLKTLDNLANSISLLAAALLSQQSNNHINESTPIENEYSIGQKVNK